MLQLLLAVFIGGGTG
ncbi:hypothetical protein, partial [Escherichia coli]